MSDARLNPESPPPPQHLAVYRKDYQPPDWLVPEVALDIALDAERTVIRARLTVERNGSHDRPLRLAGDELELMNVSGGDWRMEGGNLVIAIEGNSAVIETEVAIAPNANSKLMGLYASGGILCTQCEAEGFRRITFHPDRPDVLSRYKVRMTADRARYPVLLANGNCVAQGDRDEGTHWAEWEDPFPKPSYLFAMVAGDLHANRDRFTTIGGRDIDLAIWVREADLPRTAHAMESLKQAMAWDEREYGREYDLGQFNIVAVDDFNFGAMENKGLNIFNSRYVLADTDTATDADFDAVAGVVAHEYFHNWSGNRVICRDWFQLSLKEGFTVFRDQSFSADIGSAPVKRIDDVRLLRAVQFPEDSGPLAHPVRPDSYMEITNFYTATVYNKGAELIRMMKTMLGEEKFRAGADLYFQRHDGQAVTCEDFVAAMEDASGIDLSRFRLWYEQAGTPKVSARLDHDAKARVATLHLAQTIPPTPEQPDKRPMPIPLRTAIISVDSGAELTGEQLILLDEAETQVRFTGIDEPPLLSINRGFSAPVSLAVERRAGELERLARSDSDPFARYEAMQELMLRVLLANARGETANPEPVIAAIRDTLTSNALDAAFKGEALTMPSEGMIGDAMEVVDPDAIHTVRDSLRRALGQALFRELGEAQRAEVPGADLSPAAKGVRRLKNVALALLAAGDPAAGAALAKAQYGAADNMTDRQGSLGILVSLDAPERLEALADFYERYRSDTLVLDKWFALQAAAQRGDTLERVRSLADHPDFTLANPNRARALIASFAMNQWGFHRQNGEGYGFVADMILSIDRLNPQVAARLVSPLGRWRRFAEDRASRMRGELERILRMPSLSKDVYEQASKSLV